MESILNQLGKVLVELQIVLNLLIPVQAQILPPQVINVKQLIIEKSEEYKVNPQLALFIVQKESNFDPLAIGDEHLTCNLSKSPNFGKPIRSRGLWQISDCSNWEVSDLEAFDIVSSTL